MEKHLLQECVTLEQAKALKGIGFNEPYCYGYYEGEILRFNDAYYTNESLSKINEDIELNLFTAPTYQHAFRWIREKFKLHQIAYINKYYIEKWFTYESAESKALDSLINDIKENKKYDI